MDDKELYSFPNAYLREFCAAVFVHFGICAADAELAADVLVKSDLRGIESHGVARLHTYFDMLAAGRITPQPNLKIIRKRPASRPSTATTAH
jgi:LDH2 family malate/lactate/ureidoglycolate dehydrogenase